MDTSHLNAVISRNTGVLNVKVKPRTTIYKHVVIKRANKQEQDLNISYYQDILQDEDPEIQDSLMITPGLSASSTSKVTPTALDMKGGELQLSSRFKRNQNSTSKGKSIREPLTGSPVIEEDASIANSPELGDNIMFESRISLQRDNTNIFIIGKADNLPQIIVPRDVLGVKVTDEIPSIEFYAFMTDYFDITTIDPTSLLHFYNSKDKIYSILFKGASVPISKCCKSSLLVRFSLKFGGKIHCTYRFCYVKNISNFVLSDSIRLLLADLELKMPYVEKPYRSLSIGLRKTGFKSSRNVIKNVTQHEIKKDKSFTSYIAKNDGFKTLRAPKNSVNISINPLQIILDRNRAYAHFNEL